MSFLEPVGRTVTDMLRPPGRHAQSVAESSVDAWIKFYRRDENASNAVISHNAKGSLIAPDAIEKLLRRQRAGEALTVHAFRRDEVIVTELTLVDAPHDVRWLSIDASIDDETRSRRAAWPGTDAGSEARVLSQKFRR